MHIKEEEWGTSDILVCCFESSLQRYFLELNLHAGFPVITSLIGSEREWETEIALIGYLAPLDVG